MIQANLQWRNGILVVLRVRGHAQAPQRQLCTALSCLLRSAAQALNALDALDALGISDGLDWKLEIPEEGEFSWKLHTWPEGQAGALCGISQMLYCGLRQLAEEFPQELDLRESIETG